MFESTIVRVHSQAAGAKGGLIKSLLIVMLATQSQCSIIVLNLVFSNPAMKC